LFQYFVSDKPDPETEIGLKEEPVNIGDPSRL
jgi:hypothetical protein